jgi:uncharacterized Fe-S cluster protein YjdI/thioredoxin-related protein
MKATREYKKGGVLIEWFAGLCEKCGHCKETLPKVYNPEARPWVNMDGDTPRRIAEVANECPTGALRGHVIPVLLAVFFFSTVATAQQPTGQARGWAWALVGAVGMNQATPAPAPSPTPSGICEQCNGTGKVGDGRVSTTCRECNGTGKTVTTPTPTPDTKPATKRGTIVMFCRPGCIYCDKWVAEVKPQLRDQWTIDERKDPEGPVPNFEILIGTRVIIHEGFLSLKQLAEIIGAK